MRMRSTAVDLMNSRKSEIYFQKFDHLRADRRQKYVVEGIKERNALVQENIFS